MGCLGPEVSLANWPDGHSSAVVVTFDVEQSQAGDLERVTDLLKEMDAKATFFVVAGYYEGVEEMLYPLHDYEVASKGWKQSHWSLDTEDQRESISKAHAWLTTQGYDPVGFRAPFLQRDGATIEVLQDLGYTYDSTDTGLLPSRTDGVIEIPLSVAYDPFWNDDVEEYLPLTYQAFETTHEKGGLFTFYTLPEHTDERTKVFLKYLKGRGVWMASATDVAQWWSKRENVSLVVDGEDALVTNHGASTIEGLTVHTSYGDEVIPELKPEETVRIQV